MVPERVRVVVGVNGEEVREKIPPEEEGSDGREEEAREMVTTPVLVRRAPELFRSSIVQGPVVVRERKDAWVEVKTMVPEAVGAVPQRVSKRDGE